MNRTEPTTPRGVAFHLSQVGLATLAVWLLFVGSVMAVGWSITLCLLISVRANRRTLLNRHAGFDPATEQQIDQAINLVATGTMLTSRLIEPIVESAKGHRARLEKDGWSPVVAEQMAAQYYIVAVTKMMGTEKNG